MLSLSFSLSLSYEEMKENRLKKQKKKNSNTDIYLDNSFNYRMKSVRRSSLDMISELPSNVIENILMFLPIQDALRTSVLSRKWRYQWAKLSQLVFDDNCMYMTEIWEYREDIVMKIYDVLLLHQGPILKFTLDNPGLKSCLEIDKMIIFLSRNGIQELTLCMWGDECHELPSYLYSYLEQLKHLSLHSCVFKPPPTFKGFRKLVSLELREIYLDADLSISNCPLLESLTLEITISFSKTIDDLSIDAPNLRIFRFKGSITYISFLNTPLLTQLSLTVNFDEDELESNFDLIKVLGCLPVIENLHLHYKFLKLLAVGNVPKKLPTVLNKLKSLELSDISITEMDELSSALCLIRSSPNLQKLKFKVDNNRSTDVESVPEYMAMQDYSDVSLNKLRKVEMQLFTGLRPELDCIKFLLARSPELQTVHINPASKEIIKGGYKMFIKLTRFRRASQKAEIIILGIDEDEDD